MQDVKHGYKAFGPGLVCCGKQYAENTTFEEEGGQICGSGMMHYCTNPLDCLDYYPLILKGGQLSDFAEVTAEEEPITDDGKKYATKKLHIGAKLDLKGLIKEAFSFIWGRSEYEENIKNADNSAKLAASGDSAKLAASGDFAKLAASGDFAKLAASGDYAKLAASGDFAKLAASGDYAKLAASGVSAQLAASGYYAQLAASGDFAKLAASGYSAQLAASGYYAQLAASGDFAKLAASGDFAKLAASGYSAKLAASGYYAQLAASGDSAQLAASGEFAQLAASGEDSIVAGIGIDNTAKAALGCWICLAEWVYSAEKEAYIPVCVKAAQIDGETLKADTYYKLKNGEFVEA